MFQAKVEEMTRSGPCHCATRWITLAICAIALLLPLHHLGAASLAEQREVLHARLFLAEGSAELAVSQCRQFNERFPASALGDEALELEGRAWQVLGRPAEAATAFLNLVARHADSPLAPAALLAAGDCQLQMGQAREAQKTWQRAAQRYPASPSAIVGLLRAEGHAEREDRALRQELLRLAIELDPDSEPGLEARARWASLLREEGRDEAARPLLERVSIESRPGVLNLSALLELSRLHIKAQRPDLGLQTLQRAITSYEDSPLRGRLWLELALQQLEQGRPDEAESGLVRALELENARLDSPATSDSLCLLLGDALALLERPGEAMERWESCRCQSPEILARQAWSLGRRGDHGRAALRWSAAVDSLAIRTDVRPHDLPLLAACLEQLALAQEESGLSAMSWERLAELSRRVPADALEAATLAEVLLRQGLPSAADPLLASQRDPAAQADRRGLLRLRQALALRQRDRALELARIFRDRWPASPLLAEVDRLSPDPRRPPERRDDAGLLRADRLRQTAATPEDLRVRIQRLADLRAVRPGDARELAGELLLNWNLLRESLTALGRDRGAAADCARKAIAWADSLREASAGELMARALCHEALGETPAARTVWLRIMKEQAETPEAVAAALWLAGLPDPDGAMRADIAMRMTGDWIWHPASTSIRRGIVVAERREGRPAAALAICEGLLEEARLRQPPLPTMRTGDAWLLSESALCLEAMGDRQESRRRWLQSLAAAGPDTAMAAEVLLLVARSFQKDGMMEDAGVACNKLMVLVPGGAGATQAAGMLAAMSTSAGRHDEALALLEALDPGRSVDPALRSQWVRALYRSGREADGKAELQRLLKDAGGKVDKDTLMAGINLAKGLGQLEAGLPAEAEKTFDHVASRLRNTPQAPTAQLELGRAQLARGNAKAALRSFSAVEQDWPRMPAAARAAGLRGGIMEHAGDAAGALAAYQQAADQFQGDSRRLALGQMADAAGRMERFAVQRRILELLLEEFPSAPDRLARGVERARILGRTGETAAARSALRALQATASEDEAAEIQFRLGEVAEQDGNLPGAVLEYQKVQHLDAPGGLDWGASARFEAARCWLSLGREAEARRVLLQLLEDEGATSGHGLRAQGELRRIDRQAAASTIGEEGDEHE